MWHIAKYMPTALFSLRPANATASGGKTLITPTPFAVKMALLDVAIRTQGQEAGAGWFPALRDLDIAVRLPRHVMVVKTFVKILRPHKRGAKDTFGTGLEGPMGNTIAYRELVQFGGPIQIAVRRTRTEDDELSLPNLLPHVHYLGKRGGFMQFADLYEADALDDTFAILTTEERDSFTVEGMLQVVDDCGPRMTFEHADIYSGKRITMGASTGRILNSIVLPYQPRRSSREFTLYESVERK